MKNNIIISLALLTALVGKAKGVEEVISRGNIVTTKYEAMPEAGRYLGNGRFGAVMGPTGLSLSPAQQKESRLGASHFSHMKHWGRFRFTSAIEKHETTADYLLPMFKLYWEQQPTDISNYRQEHNVYNGVLTTSFTSDKGEVKVLSWFDMTNRDLAGLRIESSQGGQTIRMETLTDFQAYPFVFRDQVMQPTVVKRVGDSYEVSIRCPQTLNGLQTKLYVSTSAQVKVVSGGLRITLKKGQNDLFISYGKPTTKTDRQQSLQRTINRWHELWAQGGWIDFPDEHAQQTWVRSMAYLLSSYDDTSLGMIQPTNGLSGNPFPFHFVQDMEYIAPALMMLGRNDIVMAWVEKFAGEIDDMKRYAKHLWLETDGIYPPWELPFGCIEGYHQPNVPVAFCYEPHNVGYLTRLAKETADFAGDEAWTQKYAAPLIRECAAFYKSACKKGADGQYHMAWHPVVGQDEAGGRNKTDYLCSFYSAQYTFQTAIEMGLDSDGSLQRILSDGLAFQSLYSTRGTYHTAHGAEDDFGRQKHPVQLDGLAYFPIAPQPLLAERRAYEVRHDITDRARDPHFFGWTLGQFLLSGSNMKDTQGWLQDWATMVPSRYTDPDWVQIRETSANTGASFYVTTHGMILQSLLRNYVNDYWGVLDVAGCPVFMGDVEFSNIATRLGVKVSGKVSKGQIRLQLKAQRATDLRVNGRDIHINRGETKQINL